MTLFIEESSNYWVLFLPRGHIGSNNFHHFIIFGYPCIMTRMSNSCMLDFVRQLEAQWYTHSPCIPKVTVPRIDNHIVLKTLNLKSWSMNPVAAVHKCILNIFFIFFLFSRVSGFLALVVCISNLTHCLHRLIKNFHACSLHNPMALGLMNIPFTTQDAELHW